jgi:RAT1-interacting protein
MSAAKRKIAEIIEKEQPVQDAPNARQAGDDETPAQKRGKEGYNNNLPSPSAAESTPSSGTTPMIQTLAYPDVRATTVKQTPFQLPTQITSFSHDEEHVQRFDNSALRYYVEPPRGARLDYGYDRWIRKPDVRGRLDGLLNAIHELKKDPARAASVPDDGVVCWRGIMTKCVKCCLSRLTSG